MPCSPPLTKRMCLWGRIMTLYSRNVQIYYSLEHDIKRSQCRDCFLYGWGDEETWQIPAYILVVHPVSLCCFWQRRDTSLARSATWLMSPTAAPDIRMPMLVPVRRRFCDGCDDLFPGLKASPLECQ